MPVAPRTVAFIGPFGDQDMQVFGGAIVVAPEASGPAARWAAVVERGFFGSVLANEYRSISYRSPSLG
jgi:hypothetical protein